MANDNLQTYYVIWRGDEDHFMITALDRAPSHFETLDNNQIIQMCWDTEYADMEDQIENPFVGEDAAGYDLIDIITGTDVQFVGAT